MYPVAFTGVLRDGRFEGELDGLLDHGDVFYAPEMCTDESGRRLLWGWAQEQISPEVQATLAHVGALSLPREIRLEGSRVLTRPAPEVEALRRDRLEPDGDELAVPAQFELAATLHAGSGAPGWTLLGDDLAASIVVDHDRDVLRVTVSGDSDTRVLEAPLDERSSHALRVFVDGSLIEVFADADRALTTRAYPRSGSWERVRIQTDDRASALAWTLASDALDDDFDRKVQTT
jgi:beta-fructofuranosidase